MPSQYRKNRTPLKPHLLRFRGVAGEIRNLREDLLDEISGASFGVQTAWAIDPVNGNDASLGTPALPLKTMSEFNERMQGLHVLQATTLQLVGNVTDAPLWLNGTRFESTFTVSGTRTTIADAVPITVVTGLGPTGTRPWQLTTTGIDWTTVNGGSLDGMQLRFSTGQIAMPMAVVDANNVIVGPLLATGITAADSTPTTAMTIAVATLSQALLPIVQCSGSSNQSAILLNFLDLDFNFNPTTSNPMTMDSGCFTAQFYGCTFKISSAWVITSVGTINFRACGMNAGANQITWRIGVGANSFSGSVGLVMRGTGATAMSHQAGTANQQLLCMQGAKLVAVGSAYVLVTATFILGTTNPVQISQQARIEAQGIVSGSGNAGIGIDVTLGTFGYVGAAAKPTVTGASDTRVGGVARTYAQIPFVNWDATAPTAFTGNGAAIVQES